MCGSVCFESPDAVDPERPTCRWAYDKLLEMESNGKGANCWCCERTWGEVAHETVHRDRTIFQLDLAKDKTMLETFLKHREVIIQKARSTLPVRAKRAGGMANVSVRTKVFKKRFLERPPDDFWPLARYRAKFGSPSRRENKKLGHQKSLPSKAMWASWYLAMTGSALGRLHAMRAARSLRRSAKMWAAPAAKAKSPRASFKA